MTKLENNDYLARMKKVRSRFQAADLIRAFACNTVAHIYSYRDKERVKIIEEAEQRAQSLERPYNMEGGRFVKGACSEKNHPWKQWLKEWGYF